jgi:lysyl-tRNA synthetase, class II
VRLQRKRVFFAQRRTPIHPSLKGRTWRSDTPRCGRIGRAAAVHTWRNWMRQVCVSAQRVFDNILYIGYNYETMELDEILQQRRSKLDAMLQKGVPVYGSLSGARTPIGEELASFQEGKKTRIAGRIMAKRLHGKVLFIDLKDATGKLQLYIKTDYIGADRFLEVSDFDIGDIIAVSGELFKTHTGEPTLKVEDCLILSKSLRPLPEKWHGLKDVEIRYRQRYLDLLSSDEITGVFRMRSRIIKAVRDFLDARGYCEVETPMMHSIAGGAAGRPFKTSHNEYHIDLFMRIAPELYLKRLLVGGMDRVYEINKSFRNEGVSTRHNPEFTMLEVYCAYSDYQGMMRLAEELIVHVADSVLGRRQVEFQGKTIDFAAPWQQRSFAGMVKERFAIDPQDNADVMLQKLQTKGLAHGKTRLTRSQVNSIIEDILEQDIAMNPTFVTDYFTSLCPLAKTSRENPFVSERFELYVGGMEIGNAYSELNDPIEQRRRFEEEIKDLDPAEKKSVDEDYVLALEHGMPPAGGLGIGIDRLTMLLLNQPSIRDVILFPLLRPDSHE